MSSNGRVAVITGAGTGIGKASALALLRDGYSVALAGRRVAPLEGYGDRGRRGRGAGLSWSPPTWATRTR